MVVLRFLLCALFLIPFTFACDDDDSGGGPTGAGDTTPPSAVGDLVASDATETSIALTWTSPGDDADEGTADEYDIRYSTGTITSGNWSSADKASGEPSPAVAGTEQTMTVSGLMDGTEYFFAMKTGDEEPNWSNLSNVAVDTTLPGSLILVASRAGKYAIVNPATGADSVEIQPATPYQPTAWTFGWGCRRVYMLARATTSGNAAIWGCDAFDGGNLEQLTNQNSFGVTHADGSPVEEKIVFSALGSSGTYDGDHIYIIDEDGTGLTQLTFDGETLNEPDGTPVNVNGEKFPMWSPDGSKIAYYANASLIPPGYPQELWVVMDADGGNKEVVWVHETTAHYLPPTWSYDGEYLVFNRVEPGGGGERQVLALHLATLTPSNLTSGMGYTPYDPGRVCMSPQGWKLAFDRNYPGQSPLFIADLNEGGTTISVTSSDQFSPDGTGHGYGAPDWAPFYREF